MDVTIAQCRVRKCSKCQGDREYYCATCECDLCIQCKENHVKDLNTIDHYVVIYIIPKQEYCLKHPSKVCQKYCKTCEVPVCYYCRKHRTHRQLNVMSAYSMQRQQIRETIHTLRSEILFYIPFILPRIRADFETCRSKFACLNLEMSTKAQTLVKYITSKLRSYLKPKHRCLKQMRIINGHISRLLTIEHKYEQSAFCALEFLSSAKTVSLLKIHLTRHARQFFRMNESHQRKDVFQSLGQLKIAEKGKRCVGNEYLLKLLPSPKLHHSVNVTGLKGCSHISHVDSDKAWVSSSYEKPS